MKEQEFNPLEGWTKEQIKSVLKAEFYVPLFRFKKFLSFIFS